MAAIKAATTDSTVSMSGRRRTDGVRTSGAPHLAGGIASRRASWGEGVLGFHLSWTRVAGAAAVALAAVPLSAAPAGAGEQEYIRPVTFVLDGQERTCWVRHWDWRRTQSGQTTVATGTSLIDGSSQVCLDAARHASITLTYRRDSDGSLGYVSSRSPDSEVLTTVIEEGTLHDVTVAHTISFECDGERCDAGDHLITSPK